MRPVVVLDSSVFIKVIFGEPGSEAACELFDWALENDVRFLAPQHFVVEVLGFAHRAGLPLHLVLNELQDYSPALIELVAADVELWLEAEALAARSHPAKPQLVDCAFHALATRLESVFLTADESHWRKTQKPIGSVLRLADWRQLQTA